MEFLAAPREEDQKIEPIGKPTLGTPILLSRGRALGSLWGFGPILLILQYFLNTDDFSSYQAL